MDIIILSVNSLNINCIIITHFVGNWTYSFMPWADSMMQLRGRGVSCTYHQKVLAHMDINMNTMIFVSVRTHYS